MLILAQMSGYPAEAHNGAGSNTVTLPGPKGGRNGEYKADLNTEGVLSTRPPRIVGTLWEFPASHTAAP